MCRLDEAAFVVALGVAEDDFGVLLDPVDHQEAEDEDDDAESEEAAVKSRRRFQENATW